MKSGFIAWTFILAIVLLSGCEGDSGTSPNEEINTPTNLAIRVERSNEFAVDLYKKIRESDDNLVISPQSVSVAFAMLYAGARGNTEIEISDVLRFHYPQANGFHSSMSLLNEQICSRGTDPSEFKVWMANGCWIDQSYGVLQSYQDTLVYYYDTEIGTADFTNNPEQARTTINDWVYYNTSEQIEDLFPEGSITSATRLVLSNVFCFEAQWLQCFDPENSLNRVFTLLDGTTKSVLTMRGEGYFGYYDGAGYLALRLPYKGDCVSMLVLLPDEGNYSSFEDSLSGKYITSIYDSLETTRIFVGLPRFHITTALSLKEVLRSMGILSAFDPGADLSGIDGVDDGAPWVSDVIHKTTMYLNEYGTYFYSATGMATTIGEHPYFSANRPFIFAVIDEPTGVILFIGRVLDANGYWWPLFW